MNRINIKFMTESATETLRANSDTVTKNLLSKSDNSWLCEMTKNPFIEKKYKIYDFELVVSEEGDYDKVDYINSILLYESLKDLPRYILTDERFWLWIYFEKGYNVALQAMPIKSKSTFKDHWLFTQGTRRGLFFGVLARCFFRVDLTIDESLEDKYELTKFVIENPYSFRESSWRTFSSQKHIVLGLLKAEKKIVDEYGAAVTNDIYPMIAKYISRLGSVRLLDAISEEDMYNYVYNKMKEIMEVGVMNK